MAVNIDSLQIEIEATSSEAAKRVQDLADALTNLKAAAKGGEGLTWTERFNAKPESWYSNNGRY